MRKLKLWITLLVVLLVGVTGLAVTTIHAPTALAAPAYSGYAGPVDGGYARVVASPSLRLRAGPGSGYATIFTMNKGELVHVLAGPYAGGWYRVTYQGRTGYAFGGLLANSGLAGAGLARQYGRIIVVSLGRQQLEAYQNGQLVLITAVTTGQPALSTPTGITSVMLKRTNFWFISPWPKGSPYYYYPTHINYGLLFRTGGYYLHDAYWRPYYGSGTNVWHRDPDGVWRTGSHGCVNLPLWAEIQLYRWAAISTPVAVVSW